MFAVSDLAIFKHLVEKPREDRLRDRRCQFRIDIRLFDARRELEAVAILIEGANQMFAELRGPLSFFFHNRL